MANIRMACAERAKKLQYGFAHKQREKNDARVSWKQPQLTVDIWWNGEIHITLANSHVQTRILFNQSQLPVVVLNIPNAFQYRTNRSNIRTNKYSSILQIFFIKKSQIIKNCSLVSNYKKKWRKKFQCVIWRQTYDITNNAKNIYTYYYTQNEL